MKKIIHFLFILSSILCITNFFFLFWASKKTFFTENIGFVTSNILLASIYVWLISFTILFIHYIFKKISNRIEEINPRFTINIVSKILTPLMILFWIFYFYCAFGTALSEDYYFKKYSFGYWYTINNKYIETFPVITPVGDVKYFHNIIPIQGITEIGIRYYSTMTRKEILTILSKKLNRFEISQDDINDKDYYKYIEVEDSKNKYKTKYELKIRKENEIKTYVNGLVIYEK